MYEISPYATFSVSGGRTPAQPNTKTPTRLNPSSLDYTLQFKTFGHPEGCELNATAYPILPSGGFGHVKGKSSWHKQRYYNTDDDSTLSKSMTVVASNSRHRGGPQETRLVGRNGSRSRNRGDGSESDTSLSPTTEFSNAPTYRVPVKSSRGKFQGRLGNKGTDYRNFRRFSARLKHRIQQRQFPRKRSSGQHTASHCWRNAVQV